jgi:hypothetical protein
MKIVGLMVVAALLLVFTGCVQNFPSTESSPCPPYTYNPLVTGALSCDTPASEPPQKYTGIIKNKTRYEVSVPSGNSGATLIIPPRSYIEYVAWERHFDLTAYHDGKPFYCMKINAIVGNYPYNCDKYDFMVEIVKPEPKSTAPGKKMKRYKKKVVEEG